MFAELTKLELRLLDGQNRDQLIDTLMERKDELRLEFTRQWLEDQSTDRLRLLVLAAKLLSLVRRSESRTFRAP
jgi:hypothetical protein